MTSPQKPENTGQDSFSNGDDFVDFDVDDSSSSSQSTGTQTTGSSSGQTTQTDGTAEAQSQPGNLTAAVDDASVITEINEDGGTEYGGITNLANDFVDALDDASRILLTLRNAVLPGKINPMLSDDFQLTDASVSTAQPAAVSDAAVSDTAVSRPDTNVSAGETGDQKDHTAEVIAAGLIAAMAMRALFLRLDSKPSERIESFKKALGPGASEAEVTALKDIVRNAVTTGDARTVMEFVTAAKESGRHLGQSLQINAIRSALKEIGVEATWTEEMGTSTGRKPLETVLSLKMEGSGKEVRVRSDVGMVGLDRDADRMDVGDKKIFAEISETARSNYEKLYPANKPAVPLSVGEQVFSGDHWGFVTGRTSDGRLLVELQTARDVSTAVEAKDPAWYRANGYEQIEVDTRDAAGNVNGKQQLWYHKGDPESVTDPPRLLSVGGTTEQNSDRVVLVDESQLTRVKSDNPGGEQRRSIVREDLSFQTKYFDVDHRGVNMTYRHYADGVAIGIPEASISTRDYIGQRDLRIYSPDGGATKIPLYRSDGWLHLANRRPGQVGDSKFHITAISPQDAATLDRFVMPLLSEALGPNPQSEEARQLAELIISAKTKDPLNRDIRYHDQSVDRDLKDIRPDRETGEPVYRELHVGPRGQDAKQYTVYTRTAEDSRRAAEIVDRYIARRATEAPSLVLPGTTNTGALSDGRRMPGTNRVSLAREAWTFTVIPDPTFPDAVLMSDKLKTLGGSSADSERIGIGALVEQDLGDSVRKYARDNYGAEGALTQEHLDRICKDAGIKPGFLTFDQGGKLAVFASSWVTNSRGSSGDIAYMADGDRDAMFEMREGRKVSALTGRHAMYSLYELVNKGGAPETQNPMHFVELQEKATMQAFIDNRPGSITNDGDFQQLQRLRKSFLNHDIQELQRVFGEVASIPDSRRSGAITNAFVADLKACDLDASIERQWTVNRDLELKINYQGHGTQQLRISSDPSQPPKFVTKHWSSETATEVTGQEVSDAFRSYSESLKYRIKYIEPSAPVLGPRSSQQEGGDRSAPPAVAPGQSPDVVAQHGDAQSDGGDASRSGKSATEIDQRFNQIMEPVRELIRSGHALDSQAVKDALAKAKASLHNKGVLQDLLNLAQSSSERLVVADHLIGEQGKVSFFDNAELERQKTDSGNHRRVDIVIKELETGRAEYSNATDTLAIDIFNETPSESIDHEVRHKINAYDRTALMRASGTTQAYERLVAEDCIRGVGSGGQRRFGPVISDRPTYVDKTAPPEVQRVQEQAITDMKQLLRRILPTTPPQYVDQFNVIKDLIQREGVSPAIMSVFGNDINKVAIEVHREAVHYKTTFTESTVNAQALSPEAEVYIAKKQKAFESWLRPAGDAQTAGTDAVQIPRQLDNNAQAIKLADGVSRASVGRADNAQYQFSPEEGSVNRYAASRNLARRLEQAGSPQERLRLIEDARTEFQEISIKYHKVVEQLDIALDSGPGTAADLARARARGHSLEFLRLTSQENRSVSSLEDLPNHRLNEIRFLMQEALLQPSDLVGTPFETLQVPQTSPLPPGTRSLQELTREQAALESVADLTSHDAASLARNLNEPNASGEYTLKRPVAIQIGDQICTVNSLISDGAGVGMLVSRPDGQIEFISGENPELFRALNGNTGLLDKQLTKGERIALVSHYLEKLNTYETAITSSAAPQAGVSTPLAPLATEQERRVKPVVDAPTLQEAGDASYKLTAEDRTAIEEQRKLFDELFNSLTKSERDQLRLSDCKSKAEVIERVKAFVTDTALAQIDKQSPNSERWNQLDASLTIFQSGDQLRNKAMVAAVAESILTSPNVQWKRDVRWNAAVHAGDATAKFLQDKVASGALDLDFAKSLYGVVDARLIDQPALEKVIDSDAFAKNKDYRMDILLLADESVKWAEQKPDRFGKRSITALFTAPPEALNKALGQPPQIFEVFSTLYKQLPDLAPQEVGKLLSQKVTELEEKRAAATGSPQVKDLINSLQGTSRERFLELPGTDWTVVADAARNGTISRDTLNKLLSSNKYRDWIREIGSNKGNAASQKLALETLDATALDAVAERTLNPSGAQQSKIDWPMIDALCKLPAEQRGPLTTLLAIPDSSTTTKGNFQLAGSALSRLVSAPPDKATLEQLVDFCKTKSSTGGGTVSEAALTTLISNHALTSETLKGLQTGITSDLLDTRNLEEVLKHKPEDLKTYLELLKNPNAHKILSDIDVTSLLEAYPPAAKNVKTDIGIITKAISDGTIRNGDQLSSIMKLPEAARNNFVFLLPEIDRPTLDSILEVQDLYARQAAGRMPRSADKPTFEKALAALAEGLASPALENRPEQIDSARLKELASDPARLKEFLDTSLIPEVDRQFRLEKLRSSSLPEIGNFSTSEFTETAKALDNSIRLGLIEPEEAARLSRKLMNAVDVHSRAPIENIPKFGYDSAGLLRGGPPGGIEQGFDRAKAEAAINELKARGVNTYIDLEPEKTHPDIKEICRKAGIEYVTVSGGNVTKDSLPQAVELIKNKGSNGGVFVSCSNGSELTSVVIAEYQAKQQTGRYEIVAEMKAYGYTGSLIPLTDIPGLNVQGAEDLADIEKHASTERLKRHYVLPNLEPERGNYIAAAETTIANLRLAEESLNSDPEARRAVDVEVGRMQRNLLYSLKDSDIRSLAPEQLQRITADLALASQSGIATSIDAPRHDLKGRLDSILTLTIESNGSKFANQIVLDLATVYDAEGIRSLPERTKQAFVQAISASLKRADLSDAEGRRFLSSVKDKIGALVETRSDGSFTDSSNELIRNLVERAGEARFSDIGSTVLDAVVRAVSGPEQLANMQQGVRDGLITHERILTLAKQSKPLRDTLLGAVSHGAGSFEALLQLQEATQLERTFEEAPPAFQEALDRLALDVGQALKEQRLTAENVRAIADGVRQVQAVQKALGSGVQISQEICAALIMENPTSREALVETVRGYFEGYASSSQPNPDAQKLVETLNRGDQTSQFLARLIEDAVLSKNPRNFPVSAIVGADVPHGAVNPKYLEPLFKEFPFLPPSKVVESFELLHSVAHEQLNILPSGSAEAKQLLERWKGVLTQFHPHADATEVLGSGTIYGAAINSENVNNAIFDYLTQLSKHGLLDSSTIKISENISVRDLVRYSLTESRLKTLDGKTQAQLLMNLRNEALKSTDSKGALDLIADRLSQNALNHLSQTDLEWYTKTRKAQFESSLLEAGLTKDQMNTFFENLEKTSDRASGEVISEKLAATLLDGLDEAGRKAVTEYLRSRADVLSTPAMRALIQNEIGELLYGTHQRYVYPESNNQGGMRPAVRGLMLAPGSEGNQLAIRIHKTSQMHIDFNRLEVGPNQEVFIVAPDGSRSAIEQKPDGSLVTRKMNYDASSGTWKPTGEIAPLEHFVLLDNPKNAPNDAVHQLLQKMQQGDRLYVPEKLVGSLEETRTTQQREAGALTELNYQRIALAESNPAEAERLAKELSDTLGLRRSTQNGAATTDGITELRTAVTTTEHARAEAKLLNHWLRWKPGSTSDAAPSESLETISEFEGSQQITERERLKLVAERVAVYANYLEYWQLSDLYADSPWLQNEINSKFGVKTSDVRFVVLPFEGSGFEYHRVHQEANRDISQDQFKLLADLKREAEAGRLGGKVISYIDDAFDNGAEGQRKIQELREIRDLAAKSGHPIKGISIVTWFRFEADKGIETKYPDITWINRHDCPSLPTRIANKDYVKGSSGEGLPEKLKGDYTTPKWIQADKDVRTKPGADVYPYMAGNDIELEAFNSTRAAGLPGARAQGLSYAMYVPYIDALPDYYREVNTMNKPSDAQKAEVLRRSLAFALEHRSDKWQGPHERATRKMLNEIDRCLVDPESDVSRQALRDIVARAEHLFGAPDSKRQQALAELKREEFYRTNENAPPDVTTRLTRSTSGPVSSEVYDFGSGIKIKTEKYGELTINRLHVSEEYVPPTRWLEIKDSTGRQLSTAEAQEVRLMLEREIGDSFMRGLVDSVGEKSVTRQTNATTAAALASYLERIGDKHHRRDVRLASANVAPTAATGRTPTPEEADILGLLDRDMLTERHEQAKQDGAFQTENALRDKQLMAEFADIVYDTTDAWSDSWKKQQLQDMYDLYQKTRSEFTTMRTEAAAELSASDGIDMETALKRIDEKLANDPEGKTPLHEKYREVQRAYRESLRQLDLLAPNLTPLANQVLNKKGVADGNILWAFEANRRGNFYRPGTGIIVLDASYLLNADSLEMLPDTVYHELGHRAQDTEVVRLAIQRVMQAQAATGGSANPLDHIDAIKTEYALLTARTEGNPSTGVELAEPFLKEVVKLGLPELTPDQVKRAIVLGRSFGMAKPAAEALEVIDRYLSAVESIEGRLSTETDKAFVESIFKRLIDPRELELRMAILGTTDLDKAPEALRRQIETWKRSTKDSAGNAIDWKEASEAQKALLENARARRPELLKEFKRVASDYLVPFHETETQMIEAEMTEHLNSQEPLVQPERTASSKPLSPEMKPGEDALLKLKSEKTDLKERIDKVLEQLRTLEETQKTTERIKWSMSEEGRQFLNSVEGLERLEKLVTAALPQTAQATTGTASSTTTEGRPQREVISQSQVLDSERRATDPTVPREATVETHKIRLPGGLEIFVDKKMEKSVSNYLEKYNQDANFKALMAERLKRQQDKIDRETNEDKKAELIKAKQAIEGEIARYNAMPDVEKAAFREVVLGEAMSRYNARMAGRARIAKALGTAGTVILIGMITEHAMELIPEQSEPEGGSVTPRLRGT